MKLLITDLDNTLYDWVGFFATSFRAMLDELVVILGTDEDELIRQFKALHQHYGTLERPYTAVDLPAAQQRFPEYDRLEIAHALEPAFQAFDRSRDSTLRLYPGVEDTLSELSSQGVRIIGHTEAPYPTACQRLRLLRIDKYFSRLYARESDNWRPDRGRPHALIEAEGDLVRKLSVNERKPDPKVLLDICWRERAAPAQTVYVGDSLVQDISMANAAGVTSVWASYGARRNAQLWELLVNITHWTDQEVAREAELRTRGNLTPNVEITSFRELMGIHALTGIDDAIRDNHVRALAGSILKLYLDPRTWLARRIDMTEVRDFHRIAWSSTLQIRVDFEALETAGVDVASMRRVGAVVLPVILKARQLLTGFSIRDHCGESVPTLTWEETRPLIEQMLVGTASQAVTSRYPTETLAECLEVALRFFSGDVDEVARARELIYGLKDSMLKDDPLVRHAVAMLDAREMRILIKDYADGFIVMALAHLRDDGTCELFIHHDDPIAKGGKLRLPVAVCPDYQFEIRLPQGAVFRKAPRLRSVDPGDTSYHEIAFGGERREAIPVDRRKELEPWAEVRDDLLAGYAPAQPRGTEWELSLKESWQSARTGPKRSVPTIALATSAMFVAGVVARVSGVHPVEAGAALLAAVPSAYAILLFEHSDVPTLAEVGRRPRRWLIAIAVETLLGAATLAATFPPGSPLERFGWGWRGFAWVILTGLSVSTALIVAIRSHRW